MTFKLFIIKIASQAVRRLPKKLQTVMALAYFYSQLKKNKLKSLEPEWISLDRFVSKGDLVLDVGANIGRYTFRLANLVGDTGLVISVEPISRIFYMLVTLAYLNNYKNIIFLNAALSNLCHLAAIQEDWAYSDDFIFCTNTASKLTENTQANKLILKFDDNLIKRKVSLIKIDVEGLEYSVCLGLLKYIKRDWPVIIVENNDPAVLDLFCNIGYQQDNPSAISRNLILLPPMLSPLEGL